MENPFKSFADRVKAFHEEMRLERMSTKQKRQPHQKKFKAAPKREHSLHYAHQGSFSPLRPYDYSGRVI